MDDLSDDLRDLIMIAGIEVLRCATGIVRGLIDERDFQQMLGTNPNSFNETAWNIALELTTLNIHVGRLLGGVEGLPDKARSQFMDRLLEDVSESLARNLATEKSKAARRNFEDHFVSVYQERSQFYTSLPHGMGGGGIFSEASNVLARTYFPEDDFIHAGVLLSAGITTSYRELCVALLPGLNPAGGTT